MTLSMDPWIPPARRAPGVIRSVGPSADAAAPRPVASTLLREQRPRKLRKRSKTSWSSGNARRASILQRLARRGGDQRHGTPGLRLREHRKQSRPVTAVVPSRPRADLRRGAHRTAGEPARIAPAFRAGARERQAAAPVAGDHGRKRRGSGWGPSARATRSMRAGLGSDRTPGAPACGSQLRSARGARPGCGDALHGARGLTAPGARSWPMGVRWRLAPAARVGDEGNRYEAAGDGRPEYGLLLRGALNW